MFVLIVYLVISSHCLVQIFATRCLYRSEPWRGQMRLFFICCHIFGIGIIVYDFSKFFPNLLKKKIFMFNPFLQHILLLWVPETRISCTPFLNYFLPCRTPFTFERYSSSKFPTFINSFTYVCTVESE